MFIDTKSMKILSIKPRFLEDYYKFNFNPYKTELNALYLRFKQIY